MIGKPFRKVLIANRGEIACRIMRTARSMGYRTVAVFSDADANALHVRMADEAVRIGPSAPHESYLKANAILEAAHKTGAEAVHPGYGFLAENAGFAGACEKARLVFIGPPPEVIQKMGDKAAAKALMHAAGVPCVPGYSGDDQTDKRLTLEAAKLGFPMLIKAVGGGGGRGIRAVHSPVELPDGLSAARREAKNAFGDDRLILERLIEHPRHLEVQVFGDNQGNIVHLYERDCTTQRRRQKIIEEAPSPVLTPALREKLTGYALEAARAVGYRNAGTVEFIADCGFNLYFLEMNTRLQVEHPVTEMVTGVDLVEWQLRMASGEPLPQKQHEIALHGHAIEARLCAEDPYDGFKPQTGTVLYFQPVSKDGVRIDSGVVEGSEVSPFYDSMVAKIIAHAPDREEAARRLVRTLEDAPLLGITTNQQFLAQLLRSDAFEQSAFATNTIDQWAEEKTALLSPLLPCTEIWALAAAIYSEHGGSGAWFSSGGGFDFTAELLCGDERKRLRCSRSHDGSVAVAFDGTRIQVALQQADAREIVFEVSGVRRKALAVWNATNLHLSIAGSSFIFSETGSGGAEENISDGRKIAAPVSGLLAKVLVKPGQMIEAGQTLAIIEAMKMETRVVAVHAGRLTELRAIAGSQVANGSLLFEIEKQDEPGNV
jgi:geranyl-CoA carboxylase alpha subunit